jgi:hypothetical protein
MGLGNNFEQEVRLGDGELQIRGISTELEHGVLVSRIVALQQSLPGGTNEFVHGNPGIAPGGWDVVINLQQVLVDSQKGAMALTVAPAFAEGDALAVGTETHFVPGSGTGEPGATPTFVTITWSEPVQVKPGPFLPPPTA